MIVNYDYNRILKKNINKFYAKKHQKGKHLS